VAQAGMATAANSTAKNRLIIDISFWLLCRKIFRPDRMTVLLHRDQFL